MYILIGINTIFMSKVVFGLVDWNEQSLKYSKILHWLNIYRKVYRFLQYKHKVILFFRFDTVIWQCTRPYSFEIIIVLNSNTCICWFIQCVKSLKLEKLKKIRHTTHYTNIVKFPTELYENLVAFRIPEGSMYSKSIILQLKNFLL